MSAEASPDLQTTYRILRQWAQRKLQRTYLDLSLAYSQTATTYFEPTDVWDETLGQIDRRLEKNKLPPISGIVISPYSNQPEYGFWGNCQRTAVDLKNAEARRAEYAVILKEIFAASWPPTLP
jgi:hypothetical protein